MDRVNLFTSASLAHVVTVGSNANNGANADVFYVNSNNDASNSNQNIDARQSAFFLMNGAPSPLGETRCHKSLVAKANSLAGRTR